MDGFNLYREAKNDYDSLIPSKTDGLILLSLYSRFKGDDFSELDIIRAIENVYKDLGSSSNRSEYERNNRVIIEFQNYFLWRDNVKRTYNFKPFGLDFCKSIHHRLESSYSPAKIKRWFDGLLNQLKTNIDANPQTGFADWMEDHFDPRQQFLSQQIESLDEQVDRSVEELKKLVRGDSNLKVEIIETLNSLESQLEEIKIQANEMKQGFGATYEIDEILTELKERGLEEEISIKSVEQIDVVFLFNKKVRASLEHVSSRIDKIKPRIRDFYSDFNRRDFDRKTVKFMNYLLKRSVKSKKKVLLPPDGVDLAKVSNQKVQQKFTVITRRELQLSKSIVFEDQALDRKKQNEFLTKTRKNVSDAQRVKYWSNKAVDKINRSIEFDLSLYFFQILKKDGQSALKVAIRTLQKVLMRIQKNSKFRVCVEKNLIKDSDIKGYKIWKIMVKRS